MNRIEVGHCKRTVMSGTLKNTVLCVVLVFSLAACGGGGGGGGTSGGASGGGSSGGSSSPTTVALTLLAGNIGGAGSLDGTASSARFNAPWGIATDAVGNVYVADSLNGTIRKITPAGVVTTLAGSPGLAGSVDGTGADARFNDPKGVAVDGMGNLYVADTGNDTIREISPAGLVSTLAGSAGAGQQGSADGMGTEARFNNPEGIAVDSQDDVFVADAWNATIRKIDPAGKVSTFAGSAGQLGSADGTGADARFTAPEAIAFNGTGTLYVADDSSVRQITPDGVVTTVAGLDRQYGSTDGPGSSARFMDLKGIAVDQAGNLFVSDSGPQQLRVILGAVWGGNYTIRKITPSDEVSTLAGTTGITGSADGTGTSASFSRQAGIAIGPNGEIYVADTGNNTIRRVAMDGAVTTFAGQALQKGNADGVGNDARFSDPSVAAVAMDGTVFVADSDNGAIRKITASGVVSTLIDVHGSLIPTGTSVTFPTGMALASNGNLYVAGMCSIDKVSPDGVLSAFAGTPNTGSPYTCGSKDGVGTAAQFYNPQGLAIDSSGNLYTFDNGAIRKITSAGVVSTLAGTFAQSGYQDGKGSNARFGLSGSVAADSNGNVYVADTDNNAIRKVAPDGEVTTIAGRADGSAGHLDGVGTAASFDSPQGIAVDADGALYVADTGNDTIRKITPDGTVSTYIGKAGTSGIQLGQLPASLDSPLGVAIGQQGLVITTPGAVLETQSQ